MLLQESIETKKRQGSIHMEISQQIEKKRCAIAHISYRSQSNKELDLRSHISILKSTKCLGSSLRMANIEQLLLSCVSQSILQEYRVSPRSIKTSWANYKPQFVWGDHSSPSHPRRSSKSHCRLHQMHHRYYCRCCHGYCPTIHHNPRPPK